jgi:hypothetical protein
MGVTLLTMGAGNVIVLEETLKSFIGICDEVIYGDMLLFPEDREILRLYEHKYNLKSIRYEFNYIFKYGFASMLNSLAKYATNDLVMYMNTSEVIDEDYGAAKIIKENPQCNAFYFTHRTETHRWFRTYNRKDLYWSGLIHEQLTGEYIPYHKPIFMMKDLEKDMYSDFKARVLNAVKECVYFQQYLKIVDDPSLLGETDISWLHFSKDGYNSFKERLSKMDGVYKAFIDGNYWKLMSAVYDPSFLKKDFISNTAIEYQGDKKYLL